MLLSKERVLKVNLNGVWNLVLSGPRCNRGMNGNFAASPTTRNTLNASIHNKRIGE